MIAGNTHGYDKWAVLFMVILTFCIYTAGISLTILKPGDCIASEYNKNEINDDSQAEFSFEGFIEFENFHNIQSDQSFQDANKKNELRGRFEIRYGTENLYFFTVPNIYLTSTLFNSEIGEDYNYNDDTDVARNMKVSSSSYEISFNELYLSYDTENYRLRAGNQIYGWGTADVFNPTSYFNPYDMREVIFKDEDEYKEGVPSLSAMFFFDDYTLEAVFSPTHIPGRIAENGDYWQLSFDNYQLPIVFADPDALDTELSNTAYGARLSTSVMNSDISLSLYHGPDSEFLFVPTCLVVEEGNPVSVLVEPRTYVVNKIGMDYSMAMDKFVVQFEAAYSPDKRGVVSQQTDDIGGVTFPFDVKKSDHISYSAGFNYFIPLYSIFEEHEGETVFTMEWYQSKYASSNLADPLLTDLLTCRFEDQYFSNRLSVSLSGIIDTKNKGFTFWPQIGYDFQNGFSTELSYVHIHGKSDSINTTESLFYYLRNNDTLIWKVRYDF